MMDTFHPFEDAPHLAVGLSGGADSLYLSLLAHEWAKARGGKITTLTIDHQLRPESAAEASQVKTWMDKLGIDHVTLTWDGEKPKTRIQERARAARYDLLEGWCQRNGVMHLLTAHHQDDQWETLMQRLSRDSGPEGLQGIRPILFRPFGRILRPLLGVKKGEILEHLKEIDHPFVEDPSNKNLAFERVRWRENRATFEQQGYTEDYLKHLSQLGACKTKEQNHALKTFVLDSVMIEPRGEHLRVARKNWAMLDDEIKMLFLKRVIQAMGKAAYPPTQAQLSTLLSKLNHQRGVTCGGCYFVNRMDEIAIKREVGRGKKPPLLTKERVTNRYHRELL